MSKVRLRDVAAAAGVSQGTASNAFNRPHLVKPALLDQVREAALRLGYAGPAPAGRALRSGKSHAIALVVEESLEYVLSDRYTQRLLAGIAHVCDAEGSGLALVSLTSGRRVGWSIDTAIADGFILHCFAVDSPLIGLAQRRGLPFTAIDAGPVADGASVDIDNVAAARTAAEHLIGIGHRHLAVLSLDMADDGQVGLADIERQSRVRFASTGARLEGYRAACTAAGIAWSEVPVYETLNEPAATRDAVAALLQRQPRPTALLAMSDTIALAACAALADLGVAVPGDISVVGIDDIAEAALARPALTTIHQPIKEKGRIAALMLFGRLERSAVVLPAPLVIRDSTAPPPGADNRSRMETPRP